MVICLTVCRQWGSFVLWVASEDDFVICLSVCNQWGSFVLWVANDFDLSDCVYAVGVICPVGS